MFALFLKGLLIGFAIAAPVGPIGILCIQRSLHDGFKIGLMTGMGAAFADGTYGLIAGFGLTAVSSLLISHRFWIQTLGGLFLLYMGIKLILSSPPDKLTKNYDKSASHAFGTTFLLTLANPATILSFIAVFAGLGLGTLHPNTPSAITLVLGITLGSACWWIMLSGGVAFVLHKRINTTFMRMINWISGVIILAFSLFAFRM
jgi:threonine/homoserine/homoserine lactone efflux protein